MTDQPPPPPPPDTPVDPLFTHAASPFIRTQTPTPVAYASPPTTPPVLSTWVTHRNEIELALALLAYLMVLVGCAIAVQANPTAGWRYLVVMLPAAPAGLALWLFVRWLRRLDEMQKRIQVQAFGFSLGATGLMAFSLGFLEGAGVPHINWVFVVPIEGLAWGVGTLLFTLRYR
jgi:hypothetical protein